MAFLFSEVSPRGGPDSAVPNPLYLPENSIAWDCMRNFPTQLRHIVQIKMIEIVKYIESAKNMLT